MVFDVREGFLHGGGSFAGGRCVVIVRLVGLSASFLLL